MPASTSTCRAPGGSVAIAASMSRALPGSDAVRSASTSATSRSTESPAPSCSLRRRACCRTEFTAIRCSHVPNALRVSNCGRLRQACTKASCTQSSAVWWLAGHAQAQPVDARVRAGDRAPRTRADEPPAAAATSLRSSAACLARSSSSVASCSGTPHLACPGSHRAPGSGILHRPGRGAARGCLSVQMQRAAKRFAETRREGSHAQDRQHRTRGHDRHRDPGPPGGPQRRGSAHRGRARRSVPVARADDAVHAIVLWGAGGTFCAGADLRAVSGAGIATPSRHRPARPPTLIGPMGPTRTANCKPVIAAVAGHAVAGGLELAPWCDLRVAEADAIFGVFCRRWGVPLIDGGTLRLPRLIGESRALDMILTGRAVHADEALAMGLVNRVVPRGRSACRGRSPRARDCRLSTGLPARRPRIVPRPMGPRSRCRARDRVRAGTRGARKRRIRPGRLAFRARRGPQWCRPPISVVGVAGRALQVIERNGQHRAQADRQCSFVHEEFGRVIAGRPPWYLCPQA